MTDELRREWDTKGCSFSGPCLCGTENVSTLEYVWDRARLNRRRCIKFHVREIIQ